MAEQANFQEMMNRVAAWREYYQITKQEVPLKMQEMFVRYDEAVQSQKIMPAQQYYTEEDQKMFSTIKTNASKRENFQMSNSKRFDDNVKVDIGESGTFNEREFNEALAAS